MEIRKLTTPKELLEADRVIATAFLDPTWDPRAARESRLSQAGGTDAPAGEAWGLLDDEGALAAAVLTQPQRLAFAGHAIPATELHMVGSLPEARGQGGVRELVRAVLQDARGRGQLFATLIPFSFAFYRRFGFELMGRILEQRLPIDQLAGFACEFPVRQASGPEDAAAMRELADRMALGHDMAILSDEVDWAWHESGEVGDRDFLHPDCPTYGYLLHGADGKVAACLRFAYVPGEHGPFVGTMRVLGCAYESGEALRSLLGFIYRFRAKVRQVEFDDLGADLGLLVAEPDRLDRALGGHWMARALDTRGILEAVDWPEGRASLSVHVEDDFLPQNTGTYQVKGDGTVAELPSGVMANLEVPVTTFAQLATGTIGLDEALLRPTTRVNGNEETLRRAFPGPGGWVGRNPGVATAGLR